MLPARQPYPDELAFSAVLRCCRQFHVSLKRLGHLHLGRNGWRPSQLGASPLGPMAELFRLSSEDLLWNHTVFPYATAMMHRDFYGNALACATADATNHHGLGAVTQNVTLGLKRWRFCPGCVEREWATTRESWWHRSHNLPGVVVCLVHRAYLHESTVPLSSSGALPHSLPHECRGHRLGTSEVRPVHLKVAQISVAWLSRERGPGSAPTPADYRELAVAKSWLSATRDVDATLLAKALREQFSKAYLEKCGVPTTPGVGFWAALMLRQKTDLPYAPIKHALLQTLFAEPPKPGSHINFAPSGPPASSELQVDKFYSRGARAELKRLIGTGEQVSTESFLRTVGCWGAYRHRGSQLPKLRAVVREFRGSSATVKRLQPSKTLYACERASNGDPSSTQPSPSRSGEAHHKGDAR